MIKYKLNVCDYILNFDMAKCQVKSEKSGKVNAGKCDTDHTTLSCAEALENIGLTLYLQYTLIAWKSGLYCYLSKCQVEEAVGNLF